MRDIHGVGGSSRRRLMLVAARTSVLLSVIFLVFYGGINWFTAQRPACEVTAWYFDWELGIPFVPWLIIPYMSLDLLFFGAPFLCRDEKEIRVFARRILFSYLVASICFLVLPLKLAWPERPQGPGLFGDFVEQSASVPFLLEYPHNLFPSLHIVLALIVADVYGRHTRGVVRVLSYLWFTLIGVSTLLTWQHHLIDIPAGVLVAGFAFYLFRESDSRLAVTPNYRIGCYYATGALGLLALVPLIWPWGIFLLWPASALGIVAAGYFGVGPGIFRKMNGRLPWSTRLILAPVLVGQYLSWRYYRQRCRAWDEVMPGLWIGATLTETEAESAIEKGVTAVLDLTSELGESQAFRTLRYRNVPILDLTGPTQEQLQEAVAFISKEVAGGIVYVHCKIGYSRSAAVVGTYLLATETAGTVEEAVARLREVRPSIVVRPEALEAMGRVSHFSCGAMDL